MFSTRSVWINGSKLAEMLVQLVEPRVSDTDEPEGDQANGIAVDKAPKGDPTTTQTEPDAPIAQHVL
jgi:hypothetical protein